MYNSDFFFSLLKNVTSRNMFNRSKEDVVGQIHVYAFSSDHSYSSAGLSMCASGTSTHTDGDVRCVAKASISVCAASCSVYGTFSGLALLLSQLIAILLLLLPPPSRKNTKLSLSPWLPQCCRSVEEQQRRTKLSIRYLLR